MTRNESLVIAEAVMKSKRREAGYKRWRNLALLLLALVFMQFLGSRKQESALDKAHIALLNINEVIHQQSGFWDQFSRLDYRHAKAALILMNSPGGTPGDSERLYNEIHALKKQMPVTILIENQATSGALLASMASDNIYAYNSALIGSIGVVMSHTIMAGLYEKVGLSNEMFTVGKYKGYPNSHEPTPDFVEDNIQQALKADQIWFLQTVVKSRNLDKSVLPKIKEAQIYNARDGVELGLIDGISSRQEQIAMLRNEVGDLPVRNLEIDETQHWLQGLVNPKRIAGGLVQFMNLVSTQWG